MKILEGSYVEINLGAPATSIYSLSDELTCYAIKDLIDEIDECSPNFIYSLNALADDPLVEYQWGLTGSGIRKEGRNAWDVTEGENVIVAVTDTGVDYNHPDLRDNIAVNGDEIPENNVDDDGNGFVDDWKGWNSVNNNGDPMDLHGHGTHVAGIVSAAKNNIGAVSYTH
ncbi:MAG: S8 family serine peptidase, partial [Deltaproteobacteria bacterium]|nr:S8 family serine peptidase [Deltaproteobacteria bacterium]